jgi:SagB-type dehydrogenase family enzyme
MTATRPWRTGKDFSVIPALLEYHERSKHRLDQYAPGPRGLDWANQPSPFREFQGAPRISLPLAADTLATRYDDVRLGHLPPPRVFALESVALLFELSLGLSAWKSHGTNRWALRCNPSSGNLHPTEGYLLCGPIDGLSAGLYHYLSRDHVLERRAAFEGARWAGAFAGHGVLIGISSIYWREAWKYGMRAWRYCQHDCGHAIAAVSYAAAALGWQARMIRSAPDDEVALLLGLDRAADFADAQSEAPDVLMWVGDAARLPSPRPSPTAERVTWSGKANRLSAAQVPWPDIESVHRATVKPGTKEAPASRPSAQAPTSNPVVNLSFAQIARQRRSAVDFDGVTSISAAAFFRMLECLMPRTDTPPWNGLASSALVHPALMVHRVDGLEPGLYVFLRDPAALPGMRGSMRPEWLWQKAGPDHLPLFLLMPYDLRDAARLICCHQDIAADSCFALGMLARFDVAMQEAWRYRDLFWECGMLGQVLYLEAEAAGIRATGIGCFFDDEMHKLLGIRDHSWQSLYHFTMGGPMDDPRLSTLPPYEFQP